MALCDQIGMYMLGHMNDQDHQEDDTWREKLTDEQYRVLREKGTEAAFSGKYLNEKTAGMYVCAACGTKVFSSADKYDSGSGWPSFTKPVAEGSVDTASDESLGMERVEVMCPKCGGHLGHVFEDGPAEAGGQRFCINSLALDFKEGEGTPTTEDE